MLFSAVTCAIAPQWIVSLRAAHARGDSCYEGKLLRGKGKYNTCDEELTFPLFVPSERLPWLIVGV